MKQKTLGIHHITSIVGPPQENVDFYAGLLGLRFVKKTVNFDDPGTYHLYFGNEKAEPGTIITFFPWEQARQGKIGAGQVGVTTYAIPVGALPFWEERLTRFQVPFKKATRFGQVYLVFQDPHGLALELVERAAGQNSTWEFGGITADQAIKGFDGATLFSRNPESTGALLEAMGLEKIGSDRGYLRYRSSAEIGNTVDLKESLAGMSEQGVGTVHHIAWRARDEQDLLAWKAYLEGLGNLVTSVRNRNYFKSIYFREAGGILFEIATDIPGFTYDESLEALGEAFKLPAQHEHLREQLEAALVSLQVRVLKEESL